MPETSDALLRIGRGREYAAPIILTVSVPGRLNAPRLEVGVCLLDQAQSKKLRSVSTRPAAAHYLTSRAKKQEYEVFKTEELTEAEVRELMRSKGLKREQAQYRHERAGRLLSMDWMSFDFRTELLSGISSPFRALPAELPVSSDVRHLHALTNPLAGWENRL